MHLVNFRLGPLSELSNKCISIRSLMSNIVQVTNNECLYLYDLLKKMNFFDFTTFTFQLANCNLEKA